MSVALNLLIIVAAVAFPFVMMPILWRRMRRMQRQVLHGQEKDSAPAFWEESDIRDGGLAVTRVPERWDASWDSNLALSMLADDFGIDFMLPIARWIGYGGETNFHGYVLETMTWAAALLASTQRISVFATMHTAVNHPVVIAKQIATIDQVGKGRAGLAREFGISRETLYQYLRGE